MEINDSEKSGADITNNKEFGITLSLTPKDRNMLNEIASEIGIYIHVAMTCHDFHKKGGKCRILITQKSGKYSPEHIENMIKTKLREALGK